VRYRVTTDLGTVIACNCSICAKSGSLLSFVPAQMFELEQGGALIHYQFNRHVIHHMICPDCGIKAFARGAMPDGTPLVAVNVRCLDDVDLKSLTITEYDGRSQ
jgi:hypothetical protein